MTDSASTNRSITVGVEIADNGNETKLFCNIEDCHYPLTVYDNGRDSEHMVCCPEHGNIATFPNYGTFQAFLRFAQEKALEAYCQEEDRVRKAAV